MDLQQSLRPRHQPQGRPPTTGFAPGAVAMAGKAGGHGRGIEEQQQPGPHTAKNPSMGLLTRRWKLDSRRVGRTGLSGGDRIGSGPRELNVAARASREHHPWWIRRERFQTAAKPRAGLGRSAPDQPQPAGGPRSRGTREALPILLNLAATGISQLQTWQRQVLAKRPAEQTV